MFFSGQGPVYVGEYNEANGSIGALFNIGNLESFEIPGETTSITDTESQTGQRVVSARIDTQNRFNVRLNLKEPNKKNLAMILRSDLVTNAGTSVVDEVNSDTNLAAGDFLITKFQNISSVTVKDSAGSPATLANNTNYKISSTKFGRIELVDVGGFTQPFKVSYTYASREVIPAVNESGSKHFFVHMEGINTVDNSNFLVQLYKCRFNLPSAFALLNNEFGRFPLEGEVLRDEYRLSDANFGQFWRIVNPL